MQEARQILPGEIYDFEYQPTAAGILRLEFFNQMLKMKARDLYGGGLVFIRTNTWISLKNSSNEPISLVAIFSGARI